MPYGVHYDVPANEEIYGKVKTEIGDEKPDGLVVQFVVRTDAGLRHFQIWDSKGEWERFRDERVQPAVGKVLAEIGFTGSPPPPDEHEIEVVDVWSGATA
jgi:hypothetical protein